MKDFPQGNARVGDYVYFFADENDMKRKRVIHGRVNTVGIGPFARNIQIQFGRTSTTRKEVSCLDHGGRGWPAPRIILEPSLGELIQFDGELAKKFYDIRRGGSRSNWGVPTLYDVRIIRYATNSDDLRYRLMCDRCWEPIYYYELTTTVADMTVMPTQNFVSGKPEIAEGNAGIGCACPDRNYKDFPIKPEEVEPYI